MILAVTPNPALDVTYTVDKVVLHGSNRVEQVRQRAGGKGVNVARVLGTIGHPAVVLTLLGGPVGDVVRDELLNGGLHFHSTPLTGETRRTVTVVDQGNATVFNEPGPDVSLAEWAAFEERFRDLLPGAEAVTLSGSLPPGVPADAYGRLIRIARERSVPTLLDTSGEALRHGAAARPDVLKINEEEAAGLTGLSALPNVVITRGADGLHADTEAGSWTAKPPRAVAGNPTGAGDACLAALAVGLIADAPWPRRLRDAVAWSAAAVAAPVAGDVIRSVYTELRDLISVEPS